MITIKVASLKTIDWEASGGVTVHALVLAGSDQDTHHLGITMRDGRPLGLLLNHTGSELRRWTRMDFVWQAANAYVPPAKIIGASITHTAAEDPFAIDRFIAKFRLFEPEPAGDLETDRLRLVDAIGRGMRHDRARNSADAGCAPAPSDL